MQTNLKLRDAGAEIKKIFFNLLILEDVLWAFIFSY